MICALSAAVVAAETPEQYPQKPIRLVVPWAPGGSTDALARLVAEQMGRGLGQAMVVENRPGANGMMGTEVVAKAAPDGYTLLVATAETHAINPSIYSKLRYDPVGPGGGGVLAGSRPWLTGARSTRRPKRLVTCRRSP